MASNDRSASGDTTGKLKLIAAVVLLLVAGLLIASSAGLIPLFGGGPKAAEVPKAQEEVIRNAAEKQEKEKANPREIEGGA